MLKKTNLLFLLSAVFAVNLFAQAGTDRETIRQTALNYAKGWYEGNAERMESTLQTNLAKRIAQTNDKKRN